MATFAPTNGLEHRVLIACPDDACPVAEYRRLWALEFRYDDGRERYLTRRLDPDTLEPTEETWSDYDHGTVYGDYTVSGTSVTERVRYMPGSWQQDASTNAVEYVFGDQIGTMRVMLVNTNGAATRRAVYTAFGELIEVTGDGRTRYGYAGAWGYQEHDVDTNGQPDNVVFASPNAGLPFLHVGWRFYDPGTGRFLQRDPIGIDGGLNVYEYVSNRPVASVDPNGEINDSGFIQHIPVPPDLVIPYPCPVPVHPKPPTPKPKPTPRYHPRPNLKEPFPPFHPIRVEECVTVTLVWAGVGVPAFGFVEVVTLPLWPVVPEKVHPGWLLKEVWWDLYWDVWWPALKPW